MDRTKMSEPAYTVTLHSGPAGCLETIRDDPSGMIFCLGSPTYHANKPDVLVRRRTSLAQPVDIGINEPFSNYVSN